jgi:hypothetical protein
MSEDHAGSRHDSDIVLHYSSPTEKKIQGLTCVISSKHRMTKCQNSATVPAMQEAAARTLEAGSKS